MKTIRRFLETLASSKRSAGILCVLSLAALAGSELAARQQQQNGLAHNGLASPEIEILLHADSPQVFASGIISTGKEFGATFMPDGREVYFTRYDTEKKVNHIYRSLLLSGNWQPATPLEFSTATYSDLDAELSPDGRRLFFVSTRPKPGTSVDGVKKDMDIWVVDRRGDQWNEPQWVENVNSVGKEGSPSVARDGTLYFFSDRDAAPNTNSIYVSKFVGAKYASPFKLPSPVNSTSSDTSPFVSSDGKTLLFYSTRPGGYGGADLYVSYASHKRWAQPINLGAVVNTENWEYNPSVSPDGQLLYFGRNRQIYVLPLKDVGLRSLNPERFRSQVS
jgi:Tol biopolymer transport system component